MSAACLPALSTSYFVASREREARLEIRLSRNPRCVLIAEQDGVLSRIRMLWLAFKLHFADQLWERGECSYFECFDLWIKGDKSLEEFLSDYPEKYYDLDIQIILRDRKLIQEKLITTGQMMLAYYREANNLF